MKEMRRDSMSEELLQRNLLKNPAKIGKWDFYNIVTGKQIGRAHV